MKINFYISCESAEETDACIKFIAEMERKRNGGLPAFTPNASVPIAAPKTRPIGELMDEEEERIVEKNKERPNVSPGEPSISKIGPDAKQAVYNLVSDGEPIPKKYEEHAKLLWKRREIKFDGKEYYL